MNRHSTPYSFYSFCPFTLFFCLVFVLNGIAISLLQAQSVGSLVPCFNTGTGFNGNSNSYARLPNGQILCAGNFTQYNGVTVNRICRLNADGSLDGTFTANVGSGADASIDCMTILPTGQILISGFFSSYNGTPRGRIARLNANGTLDATFAMGAGASGGNIQAIAVQTDGKIIIAGGFTQYNGMSSNGIARLNTDGTLDASFNVGTGLNALATDAKIQADGKILVAGQFSQYQGSTVPTGLIRLNMDGSRDMAFNNGGVGVSGMGVTNMALQSDGKIVIGLNGTAYNGFARGFIARINADGSLDNPFYPLGPNQPCNVSLQSDGKIFVYGTFTQYDGIARNSIARANADGTIDLSFNPVSGANGGANVSAGFIFSDGTAILGGQAGSFTQYNGTSVGNVARIWLTTPAGISSTSPQRNTHNNALSTPLTLNFTQAMSAATASQSAFRVWGGMSGLKSGTYSGGGTSSIGFTPAQAYKPGELVSATLMCGAQTSMGAPVSPQVMQFRARAAGGSGSFPGQALFSPFYLGATTTPIGIATADFDNDGDADLVTADNFGTAQRVSVLTNNGQANFTITPYSCTGYNPRAITTGDVNNDGWQDIIAVDQGGMALVWFNNGSGSFGAVTTRTTLSDIVSVAVADIDADGDLDLIVSGNSNGVQILLNNGSGTFGAATNIGGGHTTTTGDIDNDDDIDIISATAGGSVNVYRNNGSGIFTSNNYSTGGANNNNIAVGDLNGDGFLDIVSAHDAVASSVAVLLNNGSGVFNPTGSSPIGLAANSRPRAIALGDFDGDGDLDIVTGNGTSNDVAVLINNGVASFTPATGSSFPVGGNTPWGITTGDFDNDGDIDIATPNNGTNNVSILLNAPATQLLSTNPVRNSNTQTPTSLTLSWSQPMTTATASLPSPASIAHNLYVWGGMSGYRSLPLSGNIGGAATQSGNTTTFTPNAVRPFHPGEEVSVTVVNAQATSGVRAKPTVYSFRAGAGSGPATFYQTTVIPVPLPLSLASNAVADVNNDGNLDAIIVEDNSTAARMFIALGDGLGGFAAVAPYNLVGGNPQGRMVSTGDFNNDGWIDIAVASIGAGPSSLNVFMNNGAGTFVGPITISSVQGIISVVPADYNGDGNLDIAITNFFGGGQINVYFGDGTGNFPTSFNVTVGGNPNQACAGDFDNDGDIDFLATNNGGFYNILTNDGTGSFSVSSVGVGISNPKAVDMDGDGDLDIVYEDGSTSVKVLENDGIGNFPNTKIIPSSLPFTFGLGVGNFDNDSRPDIFINDGTNFAVLRNNGAWSFTPLLTPSSVGGVGPVSPGDFDNDGDLDLLTFGSPGPVLLKNGIQPVVVTTSPTRNAPSAIANSSVSLTYNQTMNSAAANNPTLKIWSGFTGYKTGGTRSVAGATVTANVGGFRAGEQVWVTHKSPLSTQNVPAKPLVYGFTAKAGVGPGTFPVQLGNSPLAAPSPLCVALGDVDGDGDLDIATTDGSVGTGNNVAILKNNGSGIFSAGTSFPVGGGSAQPQMIAFADVDDDGDIDIATANLNNTVTVLKNDGTGDFTNPALGSPFAAGSQTFGIALGDVDGDGDLDIAATNSGGNTVTVLLNGSTGNYFSGSSPTVGSGPRGVALGDIDGDGALDMAVANQGSQDISILRNTGTGSFVPLSTLGPIAGSIQLLDIKFADVNSDGKLDIVAIYNDSGPGRVLVYLNIGGGSFTAAPGSPFTTALGGGAVYLAIGDLDGDGDLDIAATNTGLQNISVLLNNGAGDFSGQSAGSPFSVSTSPNAFPSGLALGDIDNDGDLDIVTANKQFTNDLTVLRNTTQPILTTFSPPRNTQTLAPNTAINLTYNQSMTTATASVQPFRVWGGMRGFRSGTYSQPSGAASAQILLSPPLLPNEEVFVSVTNAQNANSIAARPLTLQYRAGAGVGPATFFATTPVQAGVMSSTIRRSVALDYNGDGFVDMAFINDAANAVQIMQGSASGTFTLGPLVGLGGGTQPRYLAVSDFNSDGRSDMVVSCFGAGGSIAVLMNTGGAFNASSSALTSARQIAVADFNSDGAMDFAVMCSPSTVNLFFGNNNGTFSAPVPLSGAASGGRGIAAADFDNDGRIDMLTFTPSASPAAIYFRNNGISPNGTATFDAALSIGFGASESPETAQIGDFNGDGNMDMVTSSFGSSIQTLFTVWLGNGSGGFTATNYGVGSVSNFELTTGDFNGDGRLDIAAGDSQGSVQIWMNNGLGSFTQSGIGSGASAAYPIAADIDRDGDIDLLATNARMQVVPFLNQPAPMLTLSPTTLDFGSVIVGQRSSLSATINGTNLVGGITTGITQATVSAFSYAVNMGANQTQGTVSVSGGASLNISFQASFAPSTNSIFTTTVTVTTASATPLSITLSGIGILPRIPMPPVITALSTNALLVGLPLTVSGLNFTNVSQASVGGIATTVNVLSVTQAIVIVPMGFSVGQVVLTNIDGTAVSRDSVRAIVPFSPPPIALAASPLIGVVGDVVRVTGANFSTGATTLLVGGSVYASVFLSTTQLTFTLLPGMQGAIGIRTPNGSTTSSFIVRVIPPPTIQSISPTQARNGETLTLLGENYLNVLSVTAANMRLDSTSWEIDTLRQRLTVRVLENTADNGTIGTITIVTRSGSAQFTQAYTSTGAPIGVPEPRLIAVQPVTSGTVLQEGDEILLSSLNIPTGATLSVSINGITATISSVTVSSTGAVLRVILPAGIVPLAQQSASNLTFRLQYGTISTSATFFAPVRAGNLPAFAAVTPSIGGTCSTISIVGQNFGVEPRGRVLNVFVGGVAVRAFRVVSPRLIQATLGTVRTGLVTVLLSNGMTTTQLSTTAVFTFDSTFRCLPPMRREDSLALDAFYVATIGLNWTTSTNWTNPDIPAALRFGVKTEGDRVTEIRMPANNVSGSIPEFVMQNLRTLKVLDLQDNLISSALPNTLGEARDLEILRLGGNRFVGSVPDLRPLTLLKEVDLSRNDLVGTLDTNWVWERLEVLNLSRNRFSGIIGRGIGRLKLLKSLNLSGNLLTGTLPDELGSLTELQTLILANNRLTGRIPTALATNATIQRSAAKTVLRLTAAEGLQMLDLSNNRLEGTVPYQLGNLIGLRSLSLDNNNLIGAVPQELTRLQRLAALGLAGNRLSDMPSLAGIVRLDTVRLAGNVLEFGGLEKQATIRFLAGARQIPQTQRFTYTDQKTVLRIAETDETSATIDASFQLRINTSGANNRYEWWKDSAIVQTASTIASFRIPVVAVSDSGSYRCVVSNTLFPDLVLTSASVRVRTVPPSSVPEETVRLIAPALGAEDVSPVPTFVWSSVSGARQYRLEVSASSGFTTLLASAVVPQSAQTLASGEVVYSSAQMTGFPLASSARIFWRVRAENARGLGAAAIGEFTTAAGDALVSAERLDFGRVPRGDASFRTITLRNISASALRIEACVPDNSVFRTPLQGAFVLGAGRDTTLRAEFRPTQLTEYQAAVAVQFRALAPDGTLGALQTQNLRDRLRGRGGALKLIMPNFDTVAVRETRIVAALLVNVGDRESEINSVSFFRRNQGFELRSADVQRANVRVGDTLPIVLGFRALQAGQIWRDSLRVQTTVENIAAEGQAISKPRSPNSVPVQLTVRSTKNNLPPGAATTLEISVVPLEGFTLDSVFRAALPFVQATVLVDRNVLTLAPSESSARVRQQSNSSMQSIVLPRTAWNGRSPILAQVQCVVVAGNTDSTRIQFEQAEWGEGNVILDSVVESSFKAQVSRAGGKRLITPVAGGSLLTAVAPNPANNELNVNYTLAEGGFVSIALLDVRGNEVLSALSEVQSAGKHTLRMNTSWLPTGTYIVQMRVREEILTRQVQIIR